MIDSVYASSVEYCDQTKALMTFNDMDREEFCIAFLGALACSPCPCLRCQQRLHHREVGTLLGPGSRRCSAPMLRKNRWLDYWRHIYIYIELLQWYWEDYEKKLALDIHKQKHLAIGLSEEYSLWPRVFVQIINPWCFNEDHHDWPLYWLVLKCIEFSCDWPSSLQLR